MNIFDPQAGSRFRGGRPLNFMATVSVCSCPRPTRLMSFYSIGYVRLAWLAAESVRSCLSLAGDGLDAR